MERERIEILRSAFSDVSASDPAGFLMEHGSSIDALLYGALYWPDVFEYEGAVFLALWGDDRAETIRRLGSPAPDGVVPLSWSDCVDSFNVFEVAHLFRSVGVSDEIDRRAERAFSALLVETWGARLRELYPQREFRVEFRPVDDLYGARVTVVQLSPELVVPDGWDPRRRFISLHGGT